MDFDDFFFTRSSDISSTIVMKHSPPIIFLLDPKNLNIVRGNLLNRVAVDEGGIIMGVSVS